MGQWEEKTLSVEHCLIVLSVFIANTAYAYALFIIIIIIYVLHQSHCDIHHFYIILYLFFL